MKSVARGVEPQPPPDWCGSLTWAPEIPTKALTILKPDCCSALLTALTVDSTTSSALTTTALRIPRDGNDPGANDLEMVFFGDLGDQRAQTLVVPTSMPTTMRSLLIGSTADLRTARRSARLGSWSG